MLHLLERGIRGLGLCHLELLVQLELLRQRLAQRGIVVHDQNLAASGHPKLLHLRSSYAGEAGWCGGSSPAEEEDHICRITA